MLSWLRRKKQVFGSGITPPAPDADPRFVGKFCPQPFTMAQSFENGNIHFCCTSWLPLAAGSLHEQPLGEVWNSKWAQAIRKSILDGSYRYCSEVNCPRLQGKEGGLLPNNEVADPYFRRILDEGLTVLPKGPIDISVAHDPTCNLSCPACRSEIYRCDSEKKRLTQRIHDHMFDAGLDDAEFITLATNGDPFASPLYLSALRTFDWRAHPKLKINFITNGLRLTPEMWESVQNCHASVNLIHVSVNAMTAETFAIVQRGGELPKLLENLRFISQLRQRKAIREFTLGFYVLEYNFREMTGFIQLAKSLGVDSVFFGHVMRPQVMSDEEFQSLAVHLPTHPLHAEFLEVLRDPILQDPIVRLSNMSTFVSGEVAADGLEATFGARYKASMPWDFFQRFLQLDESQSLSALTILDAHKDGVAALYQRPSAESGAPPVALLPREGAGERVDEKLSAFLDAHHPEGAPETYAELIEALERQSRDALARALPGAGLLLNRLPVKSLQGINTAYQPLAAAARAYHALHVDDGDGLLTLTGLSRTAHLDEAESAFLKRAIDRLKDEFARLYSERLPGESESPVERLASLDEDDHAAWLQLLAAPDADLGRSAKIAVFEATLQRALAQRLGAEKWATLKSAAPGGFLAIATGHEPLPEAVDRVRRARQLARAATP